MELRGSEGGRVPASSHVDTNKRCQILEWRKIRKSARAGFVVAHFPLLHITITSITVFESGSRRWASPLARPLLRDDGSPLLDDNNKPRWAPLIKFDDREIGDRFSEAVIGALLAAHPDAFTGGGFFE
jgi:hypothetical protein